MRTPSSDSIAGQVVAYLRAHPRAPTRKIAEAVYRPRINGLSRTKAIANVRAAHKKTATHISELAKAGVLRRVARGEYVVQDLPPEALIPFKGAHALLRVAFIDLTQPRPMVTMRLGPHTLDLAWPIGTKLPNIGDVFSLTLEPWT